MKISNMKILQRSRYSKRTVNFANHVKIFNKNLSEKHEANYGILPTESACFLILSRQQYSCVSTVLVRNFERHIFHGCHKFSIFTILFLRITGLNLQTIMKAETNFKD